MKKSIIATLLCSMLSLAAAEHGSGVYLYPEILDSGKNLLAPIENTKAWRHINYPEPDKQLGRTKGGPFDPNGTVFFLNSNTTSSYYWRNYCPLKPNRTYIFGGWIRNTGARILFWFHGNHGKAKKRFNQRIYDLAGINNFIKPYLSPESLKKLAGNYNGWEICYQVFKTPDSEKFATTFAVGIYFGNGYFEAGPLFVMDVTDIKDKTKMVLHIQKSKPVKRVILLGYGNRDNLWQKVFDKPVTDFRMTLPNAHFTQRYILSIDYADGSCSEFAAPKGKYSR